MNTKLNEGWISILVSIAASIALIGVAWGMTQTKIDKIEENYKEVRTDHDILITCKIRLDSLSDDITSIKGDIKEIKTYIINKK